MGIDATAPLGDREAYQPPRVLGIERFQLAPLLGDWRRPAGDALDHGEA
jgi:hypothetical protein